MSHAIKYGFCLALSCGLVLLSACTFPPRLYRMDVRQGNYLSQEQLSRLKVGLSKSEVIEIMGSPMAAHFLNADRWDYYFYLKPGQGGAIQQKCLTLFFKGDQLVRILQPTA